MTFARAGAWALASSLALLPPAGLGATPVATERGRVGFYALTRSSRAGTAAATRLVPYARARLATLLDAELIPVDAHGASDADIAKVCDDDRVNALVVYFGADKTTSDARGPGHLAESHMDVLDCYGDIVFDGAGTAEAYVPAPTASQGLDVEARTATDRAFAALRSDVLAGGTAIANLVRYGIPIRTREKTTGLQLRSGALGAQARPLAFGTAARAGIRRGDVVTALNGTPLAGLGARELDALVAAAEAAGGSYRANVLREDGTTAAFTFESHDLAGYLRL